MTHISWSSDYALYHDEPASVTQLDAHPTGGQEVEGSTPLAGKILSWTFIMKYFLGPQVWILAWQHTFSRDWSRNYFYHHSQGSANSRRAIVSWALLTSDNKVKIPLKVNIYFMSVWAGLDGSIGCPSNWWSGGCGFDPPPGWQHFFVEIWSWNIFYGHSLSSADSRRAVVSFWRKNVHNTG